MKFFIKSILLGLSKVRVVHSIPGRLRLKIDGLQGAKYFFKDREDIPLNFSFYRLYGIKNIEFSPHTSRLLIEYDPAILRENHIINWVNRLKDIVINKFSEGETKIDQRIIDEIGKELIKEGYEMENFKEDPSS